MRFWGYLSAMEISFFVTEQGNARDAPLSTKGGGHYRARVIAFGQDNLLRPARRALSDLFENIHRFRCRDSMSRSY